MREKARVWWENIETFVLEVIFDERHGTGATLMRAVLYSLSKVFQVAVKIRRNN